MKVGLVVMGENPADALKVVKAADRAGVHSLWTIDYYNRSSLARAAAFAAVTETAIVGRESPRCSPAPRWPSPRPRPTRRPSRAAGSCSASAAAPGG